MRKFFYILAFIIPLFWISCESSSSSSTASSVAQLTSFTFARNDSMPGLALAYFTIEERNDTGLVWNKDSILYGTRLDSVVPVFKFATTPSSVVLHMPDTTVTVTGKDTLDFTKTPIYLTVRSADLKNTKVYEIRPTVHQVDPDLYTWVLLKDQIYDVNESEQRVVELNDEFIMICSNGFERHVYRSPDGAQWTQESDPFGLPKGTKIRQIISDGTTLYYGQDSAIYTSPDAVTWTMHKVNYNVHTMLLYWNDFIWALISNNDAYELATFDHDKLSPSGLKPTDNFPISDFATVCFHSSSLRERAMIIGGFAEDGSSLNTRWNLEYSTHPASSGTYRLEEFSIGRPSFSSMTGVSVIEYDDMLMLFGGVDDQMHYFGRDILLSIDEGLTWYPADSTKNQLPESYQARQKQTAIVRDNMIYLFGGQDQYSTFSDVYRGRLNSIDW